jgi:hypothetical protein
MDLNDDDLGALAWFLARRLTPDGQPPPPVTDLLHPVDPDLLAEWTAALSEARATGRLGAVLRDAVAARPADEALRETAGLVPGAVGRPPPDSRAAALLALAAMLMAMFGVATAATAGAVLLVGAALDLPGRSAASEPTAVVAPSVRHGMVVEGPLVVEGPHPGLVVEGPHPGLVVEGPHPGLVVEGPHPGLIVEGPQPPSVPRGAPAPAAVQLHDPTPLVASVGMAPAPAQTRPPAPSPAAPRAASPAEVERPCDEEGWFYVGRRRPKGDTFVVPYAVNVRAEPPSLENRWRSDTPVRCYLRKGDRVTLDRPPADAGHGHYWVHVEPSGVIRPL